MHKAVQGLFDCSRRHGDVLYRTLDGDLKIRTDRQLKQKGLPDGFRVRSRKELIVPDEGTTARFRLACAPAHFTHGKRRLLTDRGDRKRWMMNKAEESGFILLSLDEQGLFRVCGRRYDQDIAIGAASYAGVLQVVDSELLGEALRSGIGRGKAYGLGMLVIGRAGP